ncbi:MAG: tRNA (adenosine(37)-N6)-threonylcarbamoyltransferase complex dimerization subunit type 1 TsaB [Dehalococcoidia bacterium]
MDTAGPVAGVALTDAGDLLADLAWQTRAGHAAELLPAIDGLLARAGVGRMDLRAVFVCRGPGGYAGLRVGLSAAMALAFALGIDLLSVGRLEADAYPHTGCGRRIVAVHAAGRGDLAWAVYRPDGGWYEEMAPRLTDPAGLFAAAPRGALVCGEVDGDLAAQLGRARPDLAVVTGPAFARRAVTIAALAWPRYLAGARDRPDAVEPIYLRAPHITPSRADRQRDGLP